LQRIGELDIDAEIVGVELELVARLEATILVDIEDQGGDRAVDAQSPVCVMVGIGVESHHGIHPARLASAGPAAAVTWSSSRRLCAIDLPEVSTIASALRYRSSRPARMRF